MSSDAEQFKFDLLSLRRGIQKSRAKPHKLLMILAVLDLADDGMLRENKIMFSEPLTERFKRQFDSLSNATDWCQPSLPFFHLRSSEFWNHKIKEGRGTEYGKLTTSGGGSKRILDNIEYVYLSEYAFQCFSDSACRHVLREYVTQLITASNRMLTESQPNSIEARASDLYAETQNALLLKRIFEVTSGYNTDFLEEDSEDE